MYLSSGKTGLAGRWTRVVVKNGGISVVPWGGGVVTLPEKGGDQEGTDVRN